MDADDEVVGSVQVHDPAATAGNVVDNDGAPPLLVTKTALLAVVKPPTTFAAEEYNI